MTVFRFRKRRMREIDYGKLEEIRKRLGYKGYEIAEMLGITPSQLGHYRRSGKLPADRFFAFKDSLLLAVEEKGREERGMILSLFA